MGEGRKKNQSSILPSQMANATILLSDHPPILFSVLRNLSGPILQSPKSPPPWLRGQQETRRLLMKRMARITSDKAETLNATLSSCIE